MSENVDVYNEIDENLPSPVNDNKQSIMSSLKNKTNLQSVHAHVFYTSKQHQAALQVWM